ncbi:hypothetical protein K525DRAFT_182614, partial [Schizophyllum commune Loenen D]
AAALYVMQYNWKQPYYTSALSGCAWVKELINGHPDGIRTELGMRVHVFKKFVKKLHQCGLRDNHYVTVEEQAAIFLYM